MAKLSIDIGVNLGTGIRDLGTLKMAFDTLSQSVDNYSSKISALKTNLGQLKSTSVNVNVNQNVGSISTPKFTPVPDIFADYRSGASSASTVAEFLKNKQEELVIKISKLQSIAANTSSLKIYEEAQKRIAIAQGQLAQTGASAGKGFSNISRVGGQANIVLTNFGRLAQDSAFGILGISNNINPLVESWSQLNIEAKKTPGSSVWKELGKSLTGPGGLAVGFSLVTAALSFASVGLTYWTRNTSKAKDENEKFTESLNKAKEKAYTTGIELQNLIRQAGDSALGSELQKSALIKLNKELDQYNINLTSADIKNGKATEAVKQLTLALVQQAVAQQNSEKLAGLFIKLETASENITTAKKALEDYNKISGTISSNAPKLGRGFQVATANAAGDAYRVLSDGVKNAKEEFNNIQKEINKTNEQIISATDLASKYFKVASDTAPTGEIKRLQNEIKKLRDLQEGLKDPLGKDKKINDEYKRQIKDYEAQLDRILGKEKKGTGLGQLEKPPKTFAEMIAEINRDLEAINNRDYATFDEKQLAIIGRVKEGLKEIYDINKGTKLGDKFVADREADIRKGAESSIRILKETLGTSQIRLFDFQTTDDYQQYLLKLQTISETADILGTDRIQALINETTGKISRLVESTRKFAFENATAFSSSQVNLYYEALAKSGFQLINLRKLLAEYGKQQRILDLNKIWDQYIAKTDDVVDATTKINDALNVSITDPIKELGKNIDTDIKVVSDKLRKASDSIAKSLLIKGPENIPFIAKYVADIKIAEKELVKLGFAKEFQKRLEELSNSINDAFSNFSQGFVEGIGKLAGGAKSKDAFGGLFSALTESLGKSLIKFALVSKQAQAVIALLRASLFGPMGGFAVASALALGITLIAVGRKLGEKGFAKGGYISGSGSGTSDSIPARLSNGEYVVKASSVSQYGVGFMNAINNGTFKRFANGGLATDTSYKALVNRLDMPGIDLKPQGYRALVNAPNVKPNVVVGETIIRGQDLKLVLKRADKSFSNIT